MKVVVTGGCGFIGTHLVRELLERGMDVTVIDNNIDYSEPTDARLEFIDIIDPAVIDSTLFYGVDCVFHLAAQARIQDSIEFPVTSFTTNVIGTTNILEACRINGIKKFVNSSSSAIYGLTNYFPTEEWTPTDCLNPYAASKLAAEEVVKCYSRLYGIDAYNLRYFNVFGENSPVDGPYSLVIGLFLNQLKNNQPLTVVGDGSSLRDFVYVGDVVQANIRCMMRQNKESDCEALNIGSGKNISIIEIANTISDNITFVPPRIGEAEKTLANIRKAQALLNWEPTTDLIEWLEKSNH